MMPASTSATTPSSSSTHIETPPRSSMHPPFPDPGAIIGPDARYFCLGRLGKGTFCSIHKCIDLSHSHSIFHNVSDSKSNGQSSQSQSHQQQQQQRKLQQRQHVQHREQHQQRIVAAKAELANFVDSGVIDGEAAVLKFLDSSLPPGMVPTFVDYVRQPAQPSQIMASSASAGNLLGGGDGTGIVPAAEKVGGGNNGAIGGIGSGGISAIIMEYLPGEDMHLLRDRHCQSLAAAEKCGGGGGAAAASSSSGTIPRRVSVEDAVYLVADVMLPLLKAMHEVGMVHRDVKPSNVVRTGTTTSDRRFKIVDFGLSKSFVVPKDSPFADTQRPWKGRWMSPSFSTSMTTANTNTSHVHLSTMEEQPKDMARGGCIRLERECAEFRGTSMYASLRVHQGKDHCPRDDIWGLLYVFCDLVSGGLPWMSHAAARDRSSCQILKEIVLGERGKEDWSGGTNNGSNEGGDGGNNTSKGGIGVGSPNLELVPKNGEDAIEWLLYGSEYHMARYKHDCLMKAQGSPAVDSLSSLPEPLPISKNDHLVQCLRKAFRHVASLGFVEMPDYDLIDQCLRDFCRDSSMSNDQDYVPSIDWKDRRSSKRRRTISNNPSRNINETGDVSWNLLDDEDADPLDENTLAEAENDRRAALEAAAAALDDGNRGSGGGAASSSGINNTTTPAAGTSSLDPGMSLSGEAADLARLPLQIQFRLSQVEYNAANPDTIPSHLALRDWMLLAVHLAYGTWDAASWERGNHRTDDDGYRNEVYMSMLQKCLDAAEPFNGFSDMECYYYPPGWGAAQDSRENETRRTRRRISTSAPRLVPEQLASGSGEGESESPLVVVSRTFFLLRLALDLERGKNFAPPPKLSFGFGRPGMTVGALT